MLSSFEIQAKQVSHFDTAVNGVEELFNLPDAALDLPVVVVATHGAGLELDPDLVSRGEIPRDVHPTYLHLLACLQELTPLVRKHFFGWQNLAANLVYAMMNASVSHFSMAWTNIARRLCP